MGDPDRLSDDRKSRREVVEIVTDELKQVKSEFGQLGEGADDSGLLGREVHEHCNIGFDANHRTQTVAIMSHSVVQLEDLHRTWGSVLERAGGQSTRLRHLFKYAPRAMAQSMAGSPLDLGRSVPRCV